MCDVQTGHFLMGSLGLYQVGKFLGRGSYGRVAECTKMGSNETFAIKIVDDLRAGSEEMEAMKIIRSLNPDQNNLIKIHECFQYKDYMCLVYEMLDESLEDFIGKRSFHPAHLCQIRAIAQQMLVALSGLESINVLHGDIKPDNIMFVDQITNPLKLKLIDFGLAVNPQELNVGTQMQINPFRAPEVILGLPLDVSVDMWSLAVVLATLYIGDVPFSYNSDYETIRGLFSYDFFTYEEESTTGEDDHRAFLDLLRSMLAIDPRQRMTPSSALAHDFITMNHLSGERKASYAASAKHAMREAGIKDMEERFPTTSTDVVSVRETREEERCDHISNSSMTDTRDICDAPPAGIKEEPATQPRGYCCCAKHLTDHVIWIEQLSVLRHLFNGDARTSFRKSTGETQALSVRA
uniref:Protein kinase domain-containing protein n=1 Tax=Oryzias latipes TaxID=8090 RepID=A0A3B3HYR3_ORYLA